MPTNLEVQIEQKRRLYQLLRIRQNNNGVANNVLDEFIHQTKAEMNEEDIALVEKNVSDFNV